MSTSPSLPSTAGSLPAGSGVKHGASAVVSESRHLVDQARKHLDAAIILRKLDGLTDNYHYHCRRANQLLVQARAAA